MKNEKTYKNIQEDLFNVMLQATIHKYGLLLTSKKCAEALNISQRTLDERRKACNDCPSYIETGNGRYMYPAQKVVEYQLEKTKQCIHIA